MVYVYIYNYIYIILLYVYIYIYTIVISQMLHGAGIFTYKTGSFLGQM